MYTKKNDQERANEQYRTIEAMFRKGYSTFDIARQLDLPTMNVLDVTQKIFAMDMRRERRA